MAKVEQRENMKFCFKLGKTATETYEMLQKAYGKTVVTNKPVFKWFGRFRSENESQEDNERSGRPSIDHNDENIVEIKTGIRANQRLTIREMAEDTNLSFGSVLTDDLKMCNIINILLFTKRFEQPSYIIICIFLWL